MNTTATPLDIHSFTLPDTKYQITEGDDQRYCTCPDFRFRAAKYGAGYECKHLRQLRRRQEEFMDAMEMFHRVGIFDKSYLTVSDNEAEWVELLRVTREVLPDTSEDTQLQEHIEEATYIMA